MDELRFWKIIGSAQAESDGDCEAFADAVVGQLTEMPAEAIEAFDSIFSAKMAEAYTWKLWGAAYLINGGCSDDSFEYFRCWLISQGRKVYEAAVADPDTLAKIVKPDNDEHECEDFLGVAMRAYEDVTGKPLPPASVGARPPEPAGERWDFDDQELTAKHLPKLSRLYNDGDDD